MKRRDHYLLLDAARGVAALAVVLFHIRATVLPHYWEGWSMHFLTHGYLAVDLFFLMSGLVVARAYEAKLQDGSMSVRAFCKTRFIRLWPLYFLGTVLGYACAYTSPEIAMGDAVDPMSFLLNSVFLPKPAQAGVMFPFNLAAWSLFLEVVVNLLYVGLLVRLPMRWIGALALIAAIFLAQVSIAHGSVDMGWIFETAPGGMLRVGFSFLAGVLLYRRLGMLRIQLPALSAPCLLGLLACLLLTPFETPGVAYDLLCVFVLIPAFVIAACLTRVPRAMEKTCALLGRLSYPLYMLHVPLLMGVLGHYRTMPDTTPAELAMVCGIVLTAFAACVFYDEPLRRYLHRRLAVRHPRRP